MDLIIVDDNKQFRESIEIYIQMRLNHNIVACYENGIDFLDSITTLKADIILMDIEMPEMNGIDATKQALWSNRDLKVIAVTNYQDQAYLLNLISAGFKGCVFKNAVFEELEKALKTVQKNNYYFPKNIPIDIA